MKSTHFLGFNFRRYFLKRPKTCLKLVWCDWKSLPRTNMSYRKANILFQVKPRRTCHQVHHTGVSPWGITSPKTHLDALKKSELCGERCLFFYLLVLFLPANMYYWHQALSTRCFRPKYPDILQLTAREKHI